MGRTLRAGWTERHEADLPVQCGMAVSRLAFGHETQRQTGRFDACETEAQDLAQVAAAGHCATTAAVSPGNPISPAASPAPP